MGAVWLFFNFAVTGTIGGKAPLFPAVMDAAPRPARREPFYLRKPVEIQGTAAMTTMPTARELKYPMMGRMPVSGATRPMAQAA
jgi:hypothetical protein